MSASSFPQRSRRLDVVFFTPVGTLGGAERSLLDILTVLRQWRPDWKLGVLTGGDGPLLDEAHRLGAVTAVIPMPMALSQWGDAGWWWRKSPRWFVAASWLIRALQASWTVPAYLRRVRRCLAHWQPRVLHSNGLKCHLLAQHVVPRHCHVLWHMRDFLSNRAVLGRSFPYLCRPPTLLLANSQAVCADVRRLFPTCRIETVHNGIDTSRFTPQGEAAPLDALAGWSGVPRRLRIGLVATYARWKGQDLFLHAAAALLRQGITDVAFYIIGGPVYKTRDSQFTVAELRQQIVHLGLAAHCALIPFQQDLPPIYRALDIVVHASTRPEPFGRTIIEAMACGRAVVVSAAGGAVELFTEGVDALGVPPGRLPPLIEALRQLIHDPALRQRLGTAARQTAVRRFDLQVMAQRLLPLYHELLDVDQPGQKVH